MPAQYGQVESSDIIEANRVIKTLCQKRAGCVFVDTWSLLADANGRMVQRYFLDDGLHLSPDGYRRWISGLRQAIQLANTRPKATAERNAWQAARHSAER